MGAAHPSRGEGHILEHEHTGSRDDVSFYENGLVVVGCEGCNVTATVQIEDDDWNDYFDEPNPEESHID